MTEDELDLTETDELLKALHRRLGPHGTILFLSRTGEGCENAVWLGGQTIALGMAVRAQHNLLNMPAKPFDSEGT